LGTGVLAGIFVGVAVGVLDAEGLGVDDEVGVEVALGLETDQRNASALDAIRATNNDAASVR
jgi:hypothetical protein